MKKDATGLKVGFAFGLLVSILVGIGWLGLSGMRHINADLNDILNRRWAKVELARDAVFYSNMNYRITMRVFLLQHRDKAEMDDLLAQRAENSGRISTDQDRIELTVQPGNETELLRKVKETRDPATLSLRHVLSLLVTENKTDDARQEMLSVTLPLLNRYHDAWNAFVQFEEDQMSQARERNRANYVLARRLSVSLMCLAILVAIGIAAFVTHKLVQENQQREFSKAEIRTLNEELERKVVKRTLQLQQEIASRQQKENDLLRLAAIVECSDDAIIGRTNDGRILSWNAGAERIYGYSAADMIGESVTKLGAPDRATEMQDNFEKVRRGERLEQLETLVTRKDGRQIEISLTISPMRDAAGNIIGASSISRDITERKRLERMLRQAQKMEAVGRLAGGVAHDFNNLLGVIIGYSELLLDQLPEANPQRKHTEQIKKAANRATSLTRQLLAFSRQQVLETKVVNLNSIVTDMEKMLPRLIGEDIEIRTSLLSSVGQVKADPGQIEQVIMNLAVNARDAMPDGGKLILETSNADLDAWYAEDHPPLVPGRYVMLSVSDTGSGMDAQTQAHIFEPFFTTKEPGKGTGLGLATVYGVVKQSGGYVWVYSEVGLGSTFKLYLPRVDAAVQQVGPTIITAGRPQRTETILLVEDEQSLRTLTRALLEQGGYKVLEASGGNEALDIGRTYTGPIHLLLTDMVMPGMNGQAVADNMVAIRPDIRVVFMSGYTGFTHRGMLEANAILLAKPFTRDVLLNKLQEALAVEEVKRS